MKSLYGRPTVDKTDDIQNNMNETSWQNGASISAQNVRQI